MAASASKKEATRQLLVNGDSSGNHQQRQRTLCPSTPPSRSSSCSIQFGGGFFYCLPVRGHRATKPSGRRPTTSSSGKSQSQPPKPRREAAHAIPVAPNHEAHQQRETESVHLLSTSYQPTKAAQTCQPKKASRSQKICYRHRFPINPTELSMAPAPPDSSGGKRKKLSGM